MDNMQKKCFVKSAAAYRQAYGRGFGAWGMLLCAMLLLGLFAGCKGKEENLSGEHEPLTITSFNGLLTEEFLAAFHETYPEVNLEVISYAGSNGSGYAMHSLEQGDIPDIYVTSQSFSKESQIKYLLDLSNYGFVNNYSTALLNSLDIDGSIYLLPSGYQLSGIYYNKTILEENGWSVPQSFEELVTLSEKISAAGYQAVGHAMALDGYPFNFFFNIGNTVYFGTPAGTTWKEEFPKGEARAVGNSELKKTAEYFNEWVENGFITTQHMDMDEFYEGGCVFYLCLAITKYENVSKDGKTYEFGTMPWLSKDGSNNMLTRSISRYMGINKDLSKKGNEQKLDDALKLLGYISTLEGQQALMSGNSEYISSLNGGVLPEDSPYKELAGLIDAGRTVPLLYVGWEKQIVPIARDIKRLIGKETTADGLLEAFDRTNDGILNNSSEDVYATVEQTLTLAETARLVAIAEGKAAGADCALVSLNENHGGGLCNKYGLAWYLYKGDVNTDVINIIRPRAASIAVLEMTGAEIKAMRDAGFDLDGNGRPYGYLLFTKGDKELEDAAIYRLAVSAGELLEEQLSGAAVVEIPVASAIADYLRELGNVTADALLWE